MSSHARLNFGIAMKEARKHPDRNWNQTTCGNKINENLPHDYPNKFNQKKVSRIERGEVDLHITKIEVETIANILSLNEEVVKPFLDEILNHVKPEPVFPVLNVNEIGQIICNSSHKELQYYYGEYNCVFFSTDSSFKEPIRGTLLIEKGTTDKSPCSAHFTIYSNSGRPIKWYSGPFMLNSHYRTWHCILVGHEKQEVCMLTASQFNATIRNNMINVALALTTSAGMQKRPTVHRMILSRNKIEEEQINLLLAQLRLNSDSIMISEDKLAELEETASFFEDGTIEKQVLMECISLIKKEGEKIVYYRIDESLIYDTQKINFNKKIKGWAISHIRNHTDANYYNKVSQTVHDICSNITDLE